MSSARQRAIETLDQGAAERRDWNPVPTSAHYRAYKWWAAKTGKQPLRENFCHYWRVVLIWAPLRWLALPAMIALAAVALAAVVWLIIAFPSVTPFVIAGVLGFCYLVFGVLIGHQLLYDLKLIRHTYDNNPIEWFGVESPNLHSVMVLAAAPVLTVFAAGVLVVGPLVVIVKRLERDHDVFSRTFDWFVEARISDRRAVSWIRPWLVVPVAVIAFAIIPSPARPVFQVIVGMFAAIGAIIGIGTLLAWLSDKHAQAARRRAAAIGKREIDETIRVIFEVQNPDRAGDDAYYAQWREEYDAQWLKRRGSVYDDSAWYHVMQLDWNQRDLVNERLRRGHPLDRDRKPSRLGTSLRRLAANTGDYLSLVWSVVLTKKWKICPWVDIAE